MIEKFAMISKIKNKLVNKITFEFFDAARSAAIFVWQNILWEVFIKRTVVFVNDNLNQEIHTHACSINKSPNQFQILNNTCSPVLRTLF